MGGGSSKKGDPNFFGNKFILEREVGKGGFGKVNAARRKKDNNWFAIKTLAKELVLKSKGVELLMVERHTLVYLSEFNFPNICNIHHAYQDVVNCYIVSDLCLGGSLRWHLGLTKGKAFPEDHVLYWMCSLYQGLGHLHSKRILHRDIKPDNLLLEAPSGKLRICDFGIAGDCSEKDELSTTTTTGTRCYMAPECFHGDKKQGVASDWYQAAVVTYELFTDKRPTELFPKPPGFKESQAKLSPFSQENFQEYMFMASRKRKTNPDDDFPPPDELIAPMGPVKSKNASPELIDLLLKMLETRDWKRLGHNGFEEVKAHPWAAKFDWKGLEDGSLQPPLCPDPTQSHCKLAYGDMMAGIEGKSVVEIDKRLKELIDQNEEAQKAFADFDFSVEAGEENFRPGLDPKCLA